MAEKDIDMRELEKQLSCPTGESGLEVAKMMHESNLGMTVNTIDLLEVGDGDFVLELGHGNCAHLELLLKRADDVRYYGLELSETMYQAAQTVNAHLMDSHAVSFHLYDGGRIPFDDAMFDRIMTVNTLYFWKDPEALINEIARVLKPDGRAVITYAPREFMEKLPFIGEIFRLYSDEDVRQLIRQSPLKLVDIVHATESVTTKAGDKVTRPYSRALLGKG